jgi:hypothetical protein
MKLLITLLIFTQSSFASEICEFKQTKVKNTIIKTGNINKGEKCFISISHRKNSSLIYRTHYFDTKGQYMVFNSFGNGPSSKQTGARLYSILPNKNELKMSIIGNDLKIELGAALSINFDLDTTYINGSSGFTVIEDIKIRHDNMGGVYINSSSLPFIDFGFRFGGSPLWDLSRKFQYYDKQLSKVCEKMNGLIYVKKKGEVKRIFSQNMDTVKYLRSSCRA